MDVTEPSTDSISKRVRSSLRRWFPVDAVATVALVGLALGVQFSAALDGPFVRALVGFPLLFVLPGYALIAVLFPGRRRREPDSHRASDASTVGRIHGDGIDGAARLALSLGASVALLPLLALALSALGIAYSGRAVTASLAAVTLLGTVVAVGRRARRPHSDRFRVPLRRWTATVSAATWRHESPLQAGVNVLLAAVVVASLAGVGYAIVVPNDAESYSALSVLTETDSGDLVADGYPTTLNDSGADLVVRVENNERRSTTYQLVGELQRVRSPGTDETVVERHEFLRTQRTVGPRATWTVPHTVRPVMEGERLRVSYYLYRSDAPERPDTATAYRHVHTWVDVPVGNRTPVADG